LIVAPIGAAWKVRKWIMNQPHSLARTVSGIALIIFGTTGVGFAQDEGVKQVEQLIKKANAGVESINDTKLQLQKTMDAYNAVLAPDVKDRRDAYKKLQKEVATSEKKRAVVSTRNGEMNVEAGNLFKNWEGSTAAIQDPELRQRSQERLAQAKKRYSEIQANGQGAARLYTPFMKALQDQVTYLGHDLNAGAVASLKPEADKLNVQAKELYSAIDKTTAAATSNISQLRAD
jgi:Protein of unknown function (DUF2959)